MKVVLKVGELNGLGIDGEKNMMIGKRVVKKVDRMEE
jgi:hypothetical protein